MKLRMSVEDRTHPSKNVENSFSVRSTPFFVKHFFI